MTWLKLSDDFSDEFARAGLSDAAFRTHVEGLIWTMRRETGGLIDERDLRRFAETADPVTAVIELLAAGYWVRDGHRLRILHHMEHQPEPDLIEQRRKLTAERVRRHRRKRAGLDIEPAPRNAVTARVTRDGPGRVGKTSNEAELQRDENANGWPQVAALPNERDR